MAFWKKFYKSKYRGKEIDAAIGKAISGTLPEDAAIGSVMVKTDKGWIATTENNAYSNTYSRLLNSTTYPTVNNCYAILYNKRDEDGNLETDYLQQEYSATGDTLNSYYLEQRGTLLRFTDTPFTQICYSLNATTITKIVTALAADLTTIISNGSGAVTVFFADTDPDDSDALHKLTELVNENLAPYVTNPGDLYTNIVSRCLNFMGYPTPVFTIVNNSEYNISSSVSGSCIICVSALYNIKIDFIFILNSDSSQGTLKMYCNVLT